MRVSPAGAKTFILKYRLHSGRVRWRSIGRVGTLPLEKARKQAQTDIGLVASGRDPLAVIDAARDALTRGDCRAAIPRRLRDRAEEASDRAALSTRHRGTHHASPRRRADRGRER